MRVFSRYLNKKLYVFEYVCGENRIKRNSDIKIFWKTTKPKPYNYQKQPPEVFCKRGVLRNATVLKKRLWYRCFPVDFLKFLRTSFLTGPVDASELQPGH